MNVKEYIESGILETYAMGAASKEEAAELLRYKEQYPEVKKALSELETDMELMAQEMAVIPPSGMWERINANIEGLTVTKPTALRFPPKPEQQTREYALPKQEGYIEVEAESTHMRVHKTWKWVFAAVFVLSKIFLIASIYYYLENRQAQEKIQELQGQLKQYQIK